MNELEWIKSVFKSIGLDSKSSHVQALDFLFSFRNKVDYIDIFFKNFMQHIKVLKEPEEMEALLDQLNQSNWNEIDQLQFKESEYYFFLRINVFMLSLNQDNDERENLYWFNFFQSKFLAWHIQ